MNAMQVKFSELRKRLGGKLLLRNESLAISTGEFHLICGNNGCGKTTLLRIIAGLEKPDRAMLAINDVNKSWGKQRKYLRHACVYLHQSPYMLDGSVRANLEYVLFHRGIKGEKKQQLIDEAIELAQIENIVYSHAKTLSGGEQQRVALARGWLRDPRIMLLDEPTANMDQEARMRTTELLARLKSHGMALLVASHDPKQFTDISDHYWLLHDGALNSSASKILQLASFKAA
jgi:tungstate transport system ATP-binding protein